tara:strand:+ start:144671 stop:145702 length:1032 start_codon:yes stop_codon:yes gene_type:complete
LKSYSTSVKKKDVIPKNDKQQDTMYQLDSCLEIYIQKYIKKYIKNKDENKKYLDKANDYFKRYGFTNILVLSNKNETISQVNIDNQRLSFSNIAIDKDDLETIIHELAHAFSSYYLGYSYLDSHGEVFVSSIFYLLNDILKIPVKELEDLADRHQVSYFSDFNLSVENISKLEYENLLLKYEDSFIKERTSKKKDFISKSFLDEYGKIITLFSNNEGKFVMTTREPLQFERDLYINSFLKLSKRELINLKIISPIVKILPDGTISKNAKNIAYQCVDFNNIDSDINLYKTFQIKESASLSRNKDLRMNKSGYKILKSKSIEQHFAHVKHFKEAVSFATKKSYG